jgi:hypothetical protein
MKPMKIYSSLMNLECVLMEKRGKKGSVTMVDPGDLSPR